MIAEAWRVPPFEIPAPGDRDHDLADEVGRWLETEVLKQKYPLYR